MADQQQSGEEEVRRLLKELELKQVALMAGGAQRKVANMRAMVFLVIAILIFGLLFGFYAAVEYLPRALEEKKREKRFEPAPLSE